MLVFFFFYLAVDICGNDTCRGKENGHRSVKRAVAYLEEYLDEFFHTRLELLLAGSAGEQVDGLHADGVDRMVVVAHPAAAEEVVEVLAVV